MTKKKKAILRKDLTVEIASGRDEILLFGGVMPNPDKVLASRGRGKGLATYDELETDAHVRTVVSKRKRAVIAREWVVNEADDSPEADEAAELIRTCIDKLDFDSITESFLDAVMKGYSIGEIIWTTDEYTGIIRPAEIKSRKPQRFVFILGDNGYELRLLTMTDSFKGIALPDRKFIAFTFDRRYDNPYGFGLGNSVFWPVFFKRKGITFWLTFCDKFGSPTAVGKYPVNASETERKTLKEALEHIANDYGIIVPEGMIVELLESTKSSTDTYEKLSRYMDEQISEVVLGETGTTNQSGTGGSNARDQVGDKVRLETAKYDADALCECLNNTLVKWIIELNMPGAPMPKLWRNFEDPEDLNIKADRDIKLTQTGVRFNKAYFQKSYNLEDGDFELAEPISFDIKSSASASFAAPAAATVAKADKAEKTNNSQQAVDDLADSLSPKELQKQMNGILAPIIKLINEGNSYEEVISELADTYDYMSIDALQDMYERAFFITSVWGRLKNQKVK